MVNKSASSRILALASVFVVALLCFAAIRALAQEDTAEKPLPSDNSQSSSSTQTDDATANVNDESPPEAQPSAMTNVGESNTPIFQDDFLPENLPETEIDAYSPWRGVAGVFFVLGILFVAVWALRKFTRNPLTFAVNRRMRIIETLPLTMGKQIHIVQVGAYVLIVGSTQSGLTLLARMRMDEVTEFVESGVEFAEEGALEPPVEADTDGKGLFKRRLDEIIGKLEAVKRSKD